MTDKTRIRAWDLPTRLFHWLLVTLVICAWVSFEYGDVVGDTNMLWHRFNGYAICVLLIWRVLWGLIGSPTSRFVNFLAWPWTAAQYGLDLIRGRERHFLGHNPLGSYMILALVAAITAQVATGLVATEHNYVTWGPLSNLVEDEQGEELTKLHGWMYFNVLILLVLVHITANILYGLIKKDPLIRAMITGTKPAGDYEDAPKTEVAASDETTVQASANTIPRNRSLSMALVCLGLAIAIFMGTVYALGGKFVN